jgi:2,4-dienoyl-CoA reductase-like NADH-dependent reductase (Old Yellow Enzyme family)
LNATENARRVLQRDPQPHLFRSFTLRSVQVKNRIMMSPMCQYSAVDGVANNWHLAHLAARAVGGAGIVCVEATHVEPRGRITKQCLGLWNDEQRDALARIAELIAQQDAVPAIQIGHAGRKASVSRPWEGTLPLGKDDGGWEVIGPSDVAFAEKWPVPRAMDIQTIVQTIDAFRNSARRAREAGFKILELHAAHGYLFHQFFSKISNRREDRYGGSLENRCRLLMETIDEVRREWPQDLPLFVRLSATDWVDGSWDIEEAIELCRVLKARGDVDLVDCSSGGNDPRQRIRIFPGYQVPLAERIRREAEIPTAAVGLISSPEAAEEIVANGRADLVVLGRVLLFNPYWPLHAANTLRAKTVPWPVQYERANIF